MIRIAGAALLLAATMPAQALEFSVRGATMTLSGPIKLGDNARFEEILSSPAGAAVRVFRLNSGGGSIGVALDIARSIRRRGGITVADGRQPCESACTIIFAGGSSRHYVNTAGLDDRLNGKRGGLGFHEGNNANSDGRGTQYSGRGSQSLINAYYELGVSGAASFVTKAGFRQMYRLSGETALRAGVATSLSPP